MRGLHLERSGGQHERGEWERRRDEIEHRQSDCTFLAHAVPHPRQALWRDPSLESLFSDLDAHPEREEGASDRSAVARAGRSTRVPAPRREQNHRRIDAERQRKEQRRIERGKDEDAAWRRKEQDDPFENARIRSMSNVAREGPAAG